MEFRLQDVKDKLRHIQTKEKEPFLFPYLQHLFIQMGYRDVCITHGCNEYGRDLVFSEFDDKLHILKHTSVVVKNKDAEMKDFESAGEIQRQIDLCFKFPFINENGQAIFSNSVLVIVNGSISNNAKQVLKEIFHPSHFVNIQNWNYQKLAEQLLNKIPTIFLSNLSVTVNKYLESQRQSLIKFNGSSDLYNGLSITDINDIYINVRTTLKKLSAEKKAYTDYDENSRKQHEENIDDSISILESGKSLVIHGIPTSGKSLLLKRIGYNALRHYKGKPIAPFYFELFHFKQLDELDIWNEVNNLYSINSNGETLNVDDFSRLCILLDGIDEMGNEKEREKFVEKISSFQNWFGETYKQCKLQIIFSTRDIDFIEKKNILPDFEKIELLPFDVGQAFQLVKRLIPGSKLKAESFVKAIKDSQLSNSLTRTPMALSLMAILYREEEIDLEELPANITELYNKFTDYYLNRWDTTKGISLQYKFEETKNILALIAKELHVGETSLISRELLIDVLNKLKSEYGYQELNDIDQFLNSLKERSGVFHYNEKTGECRFSHLAFQEYFVSIAYDDSEEDAFCDSFFDTWWSNVLIFYSGKQPKRDVFLKKVVDRVVPVNTQQSFAYLRLLSKCFQASYLMHNNTKRILTDRLINSFDSLYKNLLVEEKKNESGILYTLTTIDFIVQFRDFFRSLISSKHFNREQVLEILKNRLITHTAIYSDIVLYSIAFHTSHSEGDSKYLQEFLKVPSLDERWQRIVFIDIIKLKNASRYDEKSFRKLKKNQLKYRIYIQKQFRETAYKYLLPPSE